MLIQSLGLAPTTLAIALLPTSVMAATCDHVLPPPRALLSSTRSVTARDLIELRDIGNAGVADPTSPLGVSPDGMRVAFQIRQADIASNSYCQAMVVLDLATDHLTKIDQGGEPILQPGLWFGAITPKYSGYLTVIQPSWAPDGRSLYYLRRDGGTTQLWRGQSDGSSAGAITHNAIDVASFAWSSDHRSILIQDLPHYPELASAILREGLGGYHYDARWQLDEDTTKPIVFDRETPRIRAIDPATGDAFAAVGSAVTPSWHAPEDERIARRPDGGVATIVPQDPANLVSDQVVALQMPSASSERCTSPNCAGRIAGVWWARDRADVVFLRYEGWAHEDSALYRWDPERQTVTLILRTQTLMTGCRMSGVGLLCMAENALQPRRIVAIDEQTGALKNLFDPNPEFADLALDSVQRLHWKNALGMEAFGDLVLPPGHLSGQRHPLVVTQYQSKGFLRGGTGDAYPIQLMAAHGYAVLSTQDPGPVGVLKPARSEVEVNRRDVVDAADARAGLSSLKTGVRMAIATGAVDAGRIALTGLSDGAFKARYAVLHSRMFKTAMISSCCDDPTSDALIGVDNMSARRRYGWPEIGDFSDPLWQSFSLLAHRRDFAIPMLIQATTDEFLSSIVTVAAMQQHDRPVDLYIYPDEYHVLWQPAHRAAYYQRDLDWLDVWLGDTDPVDADPDRAAEITRWRAMRAAWQSEARAHGKAARRPRLPRRTAGAGGRSPPS